MFNNTFIKIVIFFGLWIIIPRVSSTCEELSTCQRCISNSLCTFIKNRENKLLCTDKEALFNLQPKAVYKTPRRCNLLNKKKTTLQKQGNDWLSGKFEKGSPEQKKSGNSDAPLLRQVQDTSSIILNTTVAPTPRSSHQSTKSLLVVDPHNFNKTTQAADQSKSRHQSTLVWANISHPITTTTSTPEHKTTESQSDPIQVEGLISTTAKPKTHQTITIVSQNMSANATNSETRVLLQNRSVDRVEVVTPQYPWVVDKMKYDSIREQIIETCCKLESLFREFGDINFLEYQDIKNYNFVSFKIRNPVISRWYLCKQ